MAEILENVRSFMRAFSIIYFIVISLFAVLLLSSIAALVIGAVFHRECPIQTYIPVYLIVSGSVFVVYGLFSGVCVSDNYATAIQCLCV